VVGDGLRLLPLTVGVSGLCVKNFRLCESYAFARVWSSSAGRWWVALLADLPNRRAIQEARPNLGAEAVNAHLHFPALCLPSIRSDIAQPVPDPLQLLLLNYESLDVLGPTTHLLQKLSRFASLPPQSTYLWLSCPQDWGRRRH
jgi:hypothetical protein